MLLLVVLPISPNPDPPVPRHAKRAPALPAPRPVPRLAPRASPRASPSSASRMNILTFPARGRGAGEQGPKRLKGGSGGSDEATDHHTTKTAQRLCAELAMRAFQNADGLLMRAERLNTLTHILIGAGRISIVPCDEFPTFFSDLRACLQQVVASPAFTSRKPVTTACGKLGAKVLEGILEDATRLPCPSNWDEQPALAVLVDSFLQPDPVPSDTVRQTFGALLRGIDASLEAMNTCLDICVKTGIGDDLCACLDLIVQLSSKVASFLHVIANNIK